MSMNAYVRFVNGAVDKKYAFMWAGFVDGIQRNQNVQISANGRLDVQQGAMYRFWQGTVKAYLVAQATGFGTRADLETFFTLPAPLNNLIFYDHYGNSHSVYILGDWTPQSQMPMLDDAGNYWIVPMIIQEADAI